MAGHRSKGFHLRLFPIFNTVIMIGLCAFFILPLLNMISTSVSDTVAIADGKVGIWPVGWETHGYQFLISNSDVLIAYRNTILYAALSVVITLLVTILTAYPLSHKSLPGNTFFTFFFAMTMFFSGGLIPTYLVIRQLDLINKIWSIILPTAFSMWYIIITRTTFQQIPESLAESARIDGANHFVILFRIVLPLSKAILAAVALYTIVMQWNNYFYPMIYLSDQNLMPLQVVLRNYIAPAAGAGDRGMQSALKAFESSGAVSSYGYREMLRTVAMVLSIGPVVLSYPFLQRYFVKGILVGSIKG